MIRLLDHKIEQRKTTNDIGEEVLADVVRFVTFLDHSSTVHTLHFHPAGTVVSGAAEDEPRVIGEPHPVTRETIPEFVFHTAEEAIAAYENGKVI